MFRVVLAAILTVAIVGVALPAVEDAEANRVNQLTASEVDRLTDAIATLARENVAVASPTAAARTVHTISIPASTILRSESARVAIGGVPGTPHPNDTRTRDVVAYRVGDSAYHVRWVAVDLRIASENAGDHEPLVLAGSQTVTFTLLLRNGEPVVVVTRGS